LTLILQDRHFILPIKIGKIKTSDVQTETTAPISGAEMRNFFYKGSDELVPAAGKGSRWKLSKRNETAIIPNHKELKKGTEHCLRKKLEETH